MKKSKYNTFADWRKYNSAAYAAAKKLDCIKEIQETYWAVPTKHTKKQVLKIAKKYKGTSFSSEFPGEYAHAIRNKYLNELNITLDRFVRHSKKRTLDIAKNYKGNNFRKDYSCEYVHAFKNKYLDELNKVLGHVIVRHTKESVLETAKNYKGSSFTKDYSCEYVHAQRNKYLSELKKILNNE